MACVMQQGDAETLWNCFKHLDKLLLPELLPQVEFSSFVSSVKLQAASPSGDAVGLEITTRNRFAKKQRFEICGKRAVWFVQIMVPFKREVSKHLIFYYLLPIAP